MYQDERKRKSLWDRIPTSWQALSALGLSVGAGVTIGITLVGWISLPDEVKLNREDIDINRQRIEVVERGLSSLIRELRLGNCLTMAETRQEKDECVQRYAGAGYLAE